MPWRHFLNEWYLEIWTPYSHLRTLENLRKYIERTEKKLEITQFKLKKAIQEKTKLENEKAHAEQEIKRLHGQKTLLERDITNVIHLLLNTLICYWQDFKCVWW